ncbi:MAG: tRNA uridine(34) 5-carboxymethylaminomethyl modification radical SAM/GNAT enzyme Elp3, partial [Candidatus Woesearchaeota archaeon]|nr:tRNA uridine(34) 5-carboxymethylaminomethyl modification radical SAM/GNAT enzyme Elp3 [Candidatus Woesearchaeota archaeon]
DQSRTKKRQEKLLRLKCSSSLAKEHERNESAKIRCVGLTIETKPDWALMEHANSMLELGCTRVELGVQTLSEEILKFVNRGHGLSETVESTRILKDMGFKINYHMMPGLPKSTKEDDLRYLKQTIDDQRFRPDMYKIYPTMVMKGTALHRLWEKGKYEPLKRQDAADIISDFLGYIPYWIRVMRVQRDIPTFMTEAGVDKTNLRQYVEKMMIEKKLVSKDIREREAGLLSRNHDLLSKKNDVPSKDLVMYIEEYEASDGKEFFISMEDRKRKTLFGYCRLRFPSSVLRSEITSNSALIRELHVVGTAVGIGDEGEVQHKGIGKKLLKKAEELAKEHGKDKIVVISGVGVRGYYKKLGYGKEGPYMTKMLSDD